MVFKSYPKCVAATLISVLAGCMGALGVLMIVTSLFNGFELGMIITGAIFLGAFFGLNKAAEAVAIRKYAKLAREETLNQSNNQQ